MDSPDAAISPRCPEAAYAKKAHQHHHYPHYFFARLLVPTLIELRFMVSRFAKRADVHRASSMRQTRRFVCAIVVSNDFQEPQFWQAEALLCNAQGTAREDRH